MTPKTRVLVIDDEPQILRALRINLSVRGYEVTTAATGADALRSAADHRPDVIVLDLGLPDMSGIEVLEGVRGWLSAPVIVLSARDRENDKVVALDSGADDYLTKPFGAGELLARIRVALRHGRSRSAPDDPVLAAGPIRIDQSRHEVTVGGAVVHLTPIEFKLLALLARHAGKVVTHRQLLGAVWGPRSTQTHYLRVHMASLRRKIEADPARPRWLTTEPGVGYRLRDSEEGAS